MNTVRTCIGCGEKAPKASFIRIVRSPSGSVLLDRVGNAAGRGAYVCSHTCFDRVGKSGRLSRALRMKVSEDAYESMAEQLQGITAAFASAGKE